VSSIKLHNLLVITNTHVYIVSLATQRSRNNPGLWGSAPKRWRHFVAAAIGEGTVRVLSPEAPPTLQHVPKVQLSGHGTSLRHLIFGRKLAKFVRGYLMTRVSRQPATTAITW
jgi:hypothetical protein